jgi:hypothetical protein
VTRTIILLNRTVSSSLVMAYADKAWEEQADGTWKCIKDVNDGRDCMVPELHNKDCQGWPYCAETRDTQGR